MAEQATQPTTNKTGNAASLLTGAASLMAGGGVQQTPGFQQAIKSGASAESSANSAMYGNFATGDFSVGSSGGLSLGGLLGTTSINGLILAGIGILAIAVIGVFWKKRR
jgi:hypothetical protein